MVLTELVDESENQGLKLKTKVMMENDQYLSTTLISITLKATSTRDGDTAPETNIKTRICKEESRPDGKHSSRTVTSSRVTLEHA